MVNPAYVSVASTEAGGNVEREKVRANLLIQYGDQEEKEAHLEVSIRGVPIDVRDHDEPRRALWELVVALEAWRKEGGNVYTSKRTD